MGAFCGAGRATAAQVASLHQLLQFPPQGLPHPSVERHTCPIAIPEQQHQILQLLGHGQQGAAAAGAAQGVRGSTWPLARVGPRPGGPGSHRGSCLPPGASGPDRVALAALQCLLLPPLWLPVAKGPADSHGGQQQDKRNHWDVTVTHGSGASHLNCTGSCGCWPGLYSGSAVMSQCCGQDITAPPQACAQPLCAVTAPPRLRDQRNRLTAEDARGQRKPGSKEPGSMSGSSAHVV